MPASNGTSGKTARKTRASKPFVRDDSAIELDVIEISDLNARVVLTNTKNGLIEFLNKDGVAVNTADYSQVEQVICFTPQTLIMTPKGPLPANSLRAGDAVVTRDNGAKPLAWIGVKSLGIGSLISNPDVVPVTIAAGALGQGLPERGLTVSPNHRILMRGDMNRLTFDATEVLVSAKQLVGRPGITQSVPNSVTYFHLMFETHELVMSEGSWTESFQPLENTLKGVESEQRHELLTLFPELKTEKGRENYTSVRRALDDIDNKYDPLSCN